MKKEIPSSRGEMTFDPNVFPSSYTLLYCPYKECPLNEPFLKAAKLVDHLEIEHGLHIKNPSAVEPILDRYLQGILSRDSLSEQEDTQLRLKLQTERLTNILCKQQLERTFYFREPGDCLFCHDTFPDKYLLFRHMYTQHRFNIGQLDNLVLVQDFLGTLRSKLASLQCIYCEKHFPDSACLKKHIKSKEHFKINSHDSQYDRFYIVNYMLPGTLWTDPTFAEQEHTESDGEDEGDLVDMTCSCLLCEELGQPEQILDHMLAEHSFDLLQVSADFYDRVKIVTYMRLCWRDCKCAYCSRECASSEALEVHLRTCESELDKDLWGEAQHLFPFYEEDTLLSILDPEQ